MRNRTSQRLGWPVSEIGTGMWGAGGWTGATDEESSRALDRAVALGCTFFDTALAYGDGHSERLLGALLARHRGVRIRIATKVPPMNRRWPGRGDIPAEDVFPYDHVLSSTRASCDNLGVTTIDLQQLHVWDDAWVDAPGWRRAVETLKRDGTIRAFGISVNRWEPENVLRVLQTGLVDAVQVVYNIFDQAPEDVLFHECERLGIAVIARVPFDEGSLTGTLTRESRWPDGDWRNLYFAPDNLARTLERVAPLEALAAEHGMALSDLALRFILCHTTVTTCIPGMRRTRHVDANLAASDAPRLDRALLDRLRAHRWNRSPDGCP
jgi:aryl-alcohol dehydrogenase-like predicted oxidoreductase